MELWVKPSISGRVLLSRYSKQNARTLFSVQDNGASFWTRSAQVNLNASIQDGSLHHWAMVVDQRKWSLFLNGTHMRDEVMSEEDWAPMCNQSSKSLAVLPWILGCRAAQHSVTFELGEGSCFGGEIDELRWWGKALTSEEIQKWMVAAPRNEEPGLLHRWSFDGVDPFAGLSPGNGAVVHSPLLTPSSMSFIGGPVVVETMENASSVDVRICAAVVPASSGTSATLTFGEGAANSSVGTLKPIEEPGDPTDEVNARPNSTAAFATEMLPSDAGNGVALVLCKNIRFHPRKAGDVALPFTVDAFADNGTHLQAQETLKVHVRPNSPPTVGWARAISMQEAEPMTATLGVLDVPAATEGSALSVSFWVQAVPFDVPDGVDVPILSGQLQVGLLRSGYGYFVSIGGSKNNFPSEWVFTESHLLTVSAHCAMMDEEKDMSASMSNVTLYVDGQLLGKAAGQCWGPPQEWRFGPTFGGTLDEVRVWRKELNLAEVKQLAAAQEAPVEELIARFSFDLDTPPVCHELQLLDGGMQCDHLNNNINRAQEFSSLAGSSGWQSVTSPFPSLGGSPLHATMAEGSCATLLPVGFNANGGPLEFSLPLGSPASLRSAGSGSKSGEEMLYCAANLEEGDVRQDVHIDYTGCDHLGRCNSGLAIFHVLRRGPSVLRFQVLPAYSSLRLLFSEATNAPPIGALPDLVRLLEVFGLAEDMGIFGGAWEDGNQALRIALTSSSQVMQRLQTANSSDVVRAILGDVTVRIKEDGLLRDAASRSFPSVAEVSDLEFLVCPPGTVLRAGAVACTPCPAGHMYDERQDDCVPCDAGWHQPRMGQTFCNPCPRGQYVERPGTAECKPCEAVLKGSTTQHQGTNNRNSCVCDAGMAWSRSAPDAEPACQRCTEGMLCLGGKRELLPGQQGTEHQLPLQEAGYSAGAPPWEGGQPTFMVRCANDERCPAGLELGTCPPLTQGRACGRCVEGAFPDNSECKPCIDTHGSRSLMYTWMMLCLAGSVLYYIGSKPPALFCNLDVTFAASCAVIFAALQVIAALTTMQVSWPEPVPTIKTWLAVFILDIDHQRLQCFFGFDSPVLSYMGTILTYPVLALILTLLLLFRRFVQKIKVSFSQCLNMHGLALMSIFTTIAVLSIAPLKCRTDNPDGSASVESYPSVICWESTDHVWMASGSVIASLFMVVGFIAILVRATLMYPYEVVSPGGGTHLVRFKFLFGSFTPKRFYFGLIFGIRKLLIAIVPMIAVNLVQAQLLMIMLVILANMALQCALWPWRTFSGNVLDALTAVVLMTLMTTGFMLGGLDRASSEEVAKMMVICAMLLGLTLVVITMAVYGVKHLNTGRKYGIFLSHHKVGAGLLARWVKMLLKEQGESRVFLDSDNLMQLDLLVNIVAHETETVVVLLTRETLTRPWCAMELAAAHKANVRMIPVTCGDHQPITNEFLESLPGLWTSEQLATMSSGGIDLRRVIKAYEQLRQTQELVLNRAGADIKVHQRFVEDLMLRCDASDAVVGNSSLKGVLSSFSVGRNFSMGSGGSGRSRLKSAGKILSDAMSGTLTSLSSHSGSFKEGSLRKARIAILSDLSVDEMACACRVLQKLLQEQLQETVVVATSLARLEPQFVLVLLSPRILRNAGSAEAIVKCNEDSSCAGMVPLLVGDCFDFPSSRFWNDLRQGKVIRHQEMQALGMNVVRVESAFRKLLNTLAVRFTGHGSNDIQAAEVTGMVRRIQPHLKIRKSQQEVVRCETSNAAKSPTRPGLTQDAVVACVV